MMAFILAVDFDFIAYMSKMAFFGKLFSNQWRFWNMVHIPQLVQRQQVEFAVTSYLAGGPE